MTENPDKLDALAVTPKAIAAARWFLKHWPTASVVPTAAGGVQLETDAIEFEIGPDGRVMAALFEHEDGDMVSMDATPEPPPDLAVIAEAVQALTSALDHAGLPPVMHLTPEQIEAVARLMGLYPADKPVNVDGDDAC